MTSKTKEIAKYSFKDSQYILHGYIDEFATGKRMNFDCCLCLLLVAGNISII